jgi:NADP-dependent 3-hydroxy acid dehydrogenase YdfG
MNRSATVLKASRSTGQAAAAGLRHSRAPAAKAGELQISRVLRLELNGTGIRVSSIDPGLARTDFATVRFKGDESRVEKLYAGTQPLLAEDIAEILVWVASRPPHVNIDEMLIKPTDQAAMHKVFRRK